MSAQVKPVRYPLSLSPDLYEALAQVAQCEGQSLDAQIRDFLRLGLAQWLDAHEQDEPCTAATP